MNTPKVIIFSRFNRVFAPDDKTRNGKLQNPAWWEKRLALFKETTYKCLQNQTDQDFEFWAVFNIEQAKQYKHIRNFAYSISSLPNVQMVFENDCGLTEFEPIAEMCARKYDNDYVVLVNIDSDDLYAPTTIETIKKVHYVPGMTIYMDRGYIVDLGTHKLAEYEGEQSPAPFWGLSFPKAARTDAEMARIFMVGNNMNGHHFQKNRATHAHKLPDFMYLYTVHNDNTTTGWNNHNNAKHVREEITDATRKSIIISSFGL